MDQTQKKRAQTDAADDAADAAESAFVLHAGPEIADAEAVLTKVLNRENLRTAASFNGGKGKADLRVAEGYFAMIVDTKPKFIGVHAKQFHELLAAARASTKEELKPVLVLVGEQAICKTKTTPSLAEEGVSIYRVPSSALESVGPTIDEHSSKKAKA